MGFSPPRGKAPIYPCKGRAGHCSEEVQASGLVTETLTLN